jgi:hypothetical protein
MLKAKAPFIFYFLRKATYAVDTPIKKTRLSNNNDTPVIPDKEPENESQPPEDYEEDEITQEENYEELSEEEYEEEVEELFVDPNEIFAAARTAAKKVARTFPTNREKFYTYKVYQQFKKLIAEDAKEEVIDEVGEDLDHRLEKIEKILIECENEKYPKAQEEMHTALLEAFNNYYDGLSCFLEFLNEPEQESIINAFKLLYKADAAIEEIQESIKSKLEFSSISSLA